MAEGHGGEVTADPLRKLGMTVDLAASDWGPVVQWRSSREPVDKGGSSVLHGHGTATGYANPAVNPLLRGSGPDGWLVPESCAQTLSAALLRRDCGRNR